MNGEPTLDDLERLDDLRQKGILTEEEYLAKKAEVLARPGRAMTHIEPSAPPAGPTAQQQRVNNAFLIELVGGILGFLGLGYMYAGRTNDGLIRLVAWWIVLAVMWTSVAALTAILIGVCLWMPAIVVQFGGPIWSANQLKRDMEQGLIQ